MFMRELKAANKGKKSKFCEITQMWLALSEVDKIKYKQMSQLDKDSLNIQKEAIENSIDVDNLKEKKRIKNIRDAKAKALERQKAMQMKYECSRTSH